MNPADREAWERLARGIDAQINRLVTVADARYQPPAYSNSHAPSADMNA